MTFWLHLLASFCSSCELPSPCWAALWAASSPGWPLSHRCPLLARSLVQPRGTLLTMALVDLGQALAAHGAHWLRAAGPLRSQGGPAEPRGSCARQSLWSKGPCLQASWPKPSCSRLAIHSWRSSYSSGWCLSDMTPDSPKCSLRKELGQRPRLGRTQPLPELGAFLAHLGM